MSDEKQYLTIKEFSLMVGKSQQAIYKQLSTKLKKYVKVENGLKTIEISALKEVYGIESLQPKVEKVEKVCNQVENDTNIENSTDAEEKEGNDFQPKVEKLNGFSTNDSTRYSTEKSTEQQLIDTLIKQLDEKDKQIAEFQKQADQAQRLQANLQGELKALRAEIQRLAAPAEPKEEEPVEETAPPDQEAEALAEAQNEPVETETTAEQQEVQQEKKSGFFSRIFSHK